MALAPSHLHKLIGEDHTARPEKQTEQKYLLLLIYLLALKGGPTFLDFFDTKFKVYTKTTYILRVRLHCKITIADMVNKKPILPFDDVTVNLIVLYSNSLGMAFIGRACRQVYSKYHCDGSL